MLIGGGRTRGCVIGCHLRTRDKHQTVLWPDSLGSSSSLVSSWRAGERGYPRRGRWCEAPSPVLL